MQPVTKKPTNLKLAGRALEAIRSDRYTSVCGECQKFTRQVVQSLYGSQFDQWLWKDSAHLAAMAWAGSPYDVAPSRGSVVGDILYWFATPNNPFGHVAIRVAGNQIAENSTRHAYGRNGCKGLTSIVTVRPYQLIVRLPEKLIIRP